MFMQWKEAAVKKLSYPGWLDIIIISILYCLVPFGFCDQRFIGCLGGICRYMLTDALYPRAFAVVTAIRRLQLVSIAVLFGYTLIAPDFERFPLMLCSYCGVVSVLGIGRNVLRRS
jgi:hypothetical protein